MKNLKYLFLLAVAICSISCATQQVQPAQPVQSTQQTQKIQSAQHTVQLSKADNTIVVSRNSPTFIIRLQSNPTTGYSWFAKKYDMNLIDVEGHKYFAPKTKLVGAGGHEEWLFRAKVSSHLKQPIITTIGMSYERPWEKAPAEMVMFKVIIK